MAVLVYEPTAPYRILMWLTIVRIVEPVVVFAFSFFLNIQLTSVDYAELSGVNLFTELVNLFWATVFGLWFLYGLRDLDDLYRRIGIIFAVITLFFTISSLLSYEMISGSVTAYNYLRTSFYIFFSGFLIYALQFHAETKLMFTEQL